jgi:hypothetical protein
VKLLESLLRVNPPVYLTVAAPLEDCLQTLALATRPSLERLHLRNLFADGRRYFMQMEGTRFQIRTNQKIMWSRRGRTRHAATLSGDCSVVNEGQTRIVLQGRMRLLYFLDVLLIPAFMTSLLLYAPWRPLLIAALSALLFTLSWVWHRMNARLQTLEMIFFVQKSLEEVAAVELPGLGVQSPDVVLDGRSFQQEWARFMARQHDDS